MLDFFVSKIINKFLKIFNLHLFRASKIERLREREKMYLHEMEGIFRDVVFKNFPENKLRLDRMQLLIGTTPSEAFHLIYYLNDVLGLEGDICEFGVAQGMTSALIANEIMMTNKKLWLFDTFKGLPKPTDKDELINDIFNLGSMDKYEGTMACSEILVRGELKSVRFPDTRVEIVSGLVEDATKAGRLPKKVCFAYIDFDFYQPILETLQYLDGVLAIGGVLIIDDYGFFSSGAETAVKEFLAGKDNRYDKKVSPNYAGHFCILIRK